MRKSVQKPARRFPGVCTPRAAARQWSRFLRPSGQIKALNWRIKILNWITLIVFCFYSQLVQKTGRKWVSSPQSGPAGHQGEPVSHWGEVKESLAQKMIILILFLHFLHLNCKNKSQKCIFKRFNSFFSFFQLFFLSLGHF